jgi:hypothetical protein
MQPPVIRNQIIRRMKERGGGASIQELAEDIYPNEDMKTAYGKVIQACSRGAAAGVFAKADAGRYRLTDSSADGDCASLSAPALTKPDSRRSAARTKTARSNARHDIRLTDLNVIRAHIVEHTATLDKLRQQQVAIEAEIAHLQQTAKELLQQFAVDIGLDGEKKNDETMS